MEDQESVVVESEVWESVCESGRQWSQVLCPTFAEFYCMYSIFQVGLATTTMPQLEPSAHICSEP